MTASAMVGSPRASCQMAIGSWLVKMVERSPARSSMTSSSVGGLVGGERPEQQVVDDQDLDAGPGGHEAGEASVGPGDGELVEHARAAQVEGGVAPADGGVGEGTGEVRLAESRWPHDDQAGGGSHPVRTRPGRGPGPVEAALAAEVDVFDDGVAAQLGRLQVALRGAGSRARSARGRRAARGVLRRTEAS